MGQVTISYKTKRVESETYIFVRDHASMTSAHYGGVYQMLIFTDRVFYQVYEIASLLSFHPLPINL